MKHYYFFVILGALVTIIAPFIIVSGNATNNKGHNTPQVTVVASTQGYSIINVVSPQVGSIDDYLKLAMLSKENNRVDYNNKAKIISDTLDDLLRENIASILTSYDIIANTLIIIMNSRGKLEALSIPFKPMNDKFPTKEQVLSLFSELQECISLEAWEGEPRYVSLTIGRIIGKHGV